MELTVDVISTDRPLGLAEPVLAARVAHDFKSVTLVFAHNPFDSNELGHNPTPKTKTGASFPKRPSRNPYS
ncbi:MAG: hypothetical protein ABL889_10590, partial [Terricaulis sp.]